MRKVYREEDVIRGYTKIGEGNLNNYTVNDLYIIFKNGYYKKLPNEVTNILIEILRVYLNEVEKGQYTLKGNMLETIREDDTIRFTYRDTKDYKTRYEWYIDPIKHPFHLFEEEHYIEFYRYYLQDIRIKEFKYRVEQGYSVGVDWVSSINQRIRGELIFCGILSPFSIGDTFFHHVNYKNQKRVVKEYHKALRKEAVRDRHKQYIIQDEYKEMSGWKYKRTLYKMLKQWEEDDIESINEMNKYTSEVSNYPFRYRVMGE